MLYTVFNEGCIDPPPNLMNDKCGLVKGLTA